MNVSYDSDGDSDNSEALEYERHAQDEAERELWEKDQRDEERRKAAKNALSEYRAVSLHQSTLVSEYGIHTCSTLTAAISRFETGGGFNRKYMFGMASATLSRDKMSIKWTKKYLVGPLFRVFRFARRAGIVALEEVIDPDQPTPLYFDIEIKQADEGSLTGFRLGRILKEHCRQSDLSFDNRFLDALTNAYQRHAVSLLSEGECVAGLSVVKQHITRSLVRLGYDSVNDFACTTGCRASKFSVHAVSSTLYCDSSVLTMPLVVFEIARTFTNANLKWLWQNESEWDSDEGHFRLRAIMIEKLVHNPGAADEELFMFCGFNDGPFDEAVYSARHLMRAPGCTKGDKSVCALAPLDSPSVTMKSDVQHFSKLFPGENDILAFERFCRYLINRPVSEIQRDSLVLLTGWKPSDAYPKKRNYYSEYSKRSKPLNAFTGDFRDVHGMNPANRFVERRMTKTRQRQLTLGEISLARKRGGIPKLPVFPDDCFTSEDGEYKAFKRFKVGEFLRHVHNGVEENTASAKVFAGGFHCFGCNSTFGYVKDDTKEPEYPYQDEDITLTDDHLAYMPDVDWAGITSDKKFVVMDAPMGSGKTQQLQRLTYWLEHTKGPDYRVCVVSFRQFLAIQQAKRLETECYLDLTRAELAEGPDFITICLNSLWKLSMKRYDAVIIDECGLVRRHFMSSTCTKMLDRIYDRFVPLVRDASLVVMCQDGVSLPDVQFYTEVDSVQAVDRTQVACLKFEKPLQIHPIHVTDDKEDATRNLLQCYGESFTQDQNGFWRCVRPFMVFCSQANYAEYLVEKLKEIAINTPGGDPDRVKGIWASIKDSDPFCRAFGADTDNAVLETDVIVCTSVVGAGFSIACHFHGFHAFLFTNILDFVEEMQFIRRLRFFIKGMPIDAVRDSYIFVEKGWGSNSDYAKILEDFRDVRGTMRPVTISMECKVVLEETQARCYAERRETQAKHDQLWEEWGSEALCSPYKRFSPPDEDQKAANTRLKADYSKWCQGKNTHIADMVKAECLERGTGEEGVRRELSMLETAPGWVIHRMATATGIVHTLGAAFVDKQLASELIHKRYPPPTTQRKRRDSGNDVGSRCSNSSTDILGNGNKLSNYIRSLSRLVLWLEWVYRHLKSEEVNTFWEHAMTVKRYTDTYMVKSIAFHRCMENLLMDMLCSTEESQKDYLISPGTTPFFSGLELAATPTLCRDLHQRLEPLPTDTEDKLKGKALLKATVRTAMGKHKISDQHVTEITTCPKKAREFIKTMLHKCGLKTQSSRKRKYIQVGKALCECCDHSETKLKASPLVIDATSLTNDLAVIFAMKAKRLTGKLFGKILDTPNLSDPDTELIRDAAQQYNSVATGYGYDAILERDRSIRSLVTIQRRIQEHNKERAVLAAFDLAPANPDQRGQDAVLRRIREMSEDVDALEDRYATHRETVHREAAADESEPDDVSHVGDREITGEGDGFGGNYKTNPYVDDAAVDD